MPEWQTPGMSEGLRLGVVDDHPAILRGILTLLVELCPEITETFTTSTVAGLLGVQRSLDVVVLDVRLADASDPAANVAAVVDAGLPVLLYTQEQRRGVLARCFRAGALGVVDKSEDPGVLAAAIRVVARGEPYLSSGWAAAVEDADDGRSRIWRPARAKPSASMPPAFRSSPSLGGCGCRRTL